MARRAWAWAIVLWMCGSSAFAQGGQGTPGTPGAAPAETGATADASGTRLLFGPTARALPRGQVYLGVYEVWMPFLQVGVTDRFSIGAGTPLVFGLGGHRPVWLTPKVQLVSGHRTQAAVGLLHVTAFGNGSAGIAYGVVTRGTAESAITIGAGCAYARGGGSPVVMVGGERRVGRRLALLTENYLWPGGSGVLSGGMRVLGESLTADLGLAIPMGVEPLIAFPVVNFVWRF